MKKLGIIIGVILVVGIVGAVVLSITQTNTAEVNSENNESGEDSNQTEEEQSVNNEEGNVTFHLEEKSSESAVKQFTYTVKNEGEKPTTLTFSTSQFYEYELVSEDEGLIERYSDGKGFMQVVQDIELAPEGEVSYDISFASLDPGEYTLTVFSTAQDLAGSEKSIEFIVE